MNAFGGQMVIFAYILFAFALFPFIFRTLFNNTGRYLKARLRESDQVDGFMRNAEYSQMEARSVMDCQSPEESAWNRREHGGA